jgi:hypothetical protein
MSICEEPPQRKNRIVLLALPGFDAALAAAIAGTGAPNLKPAKPTPEATRNARRETGAACRTGEIRE